MLPRLAARLIYRQSRPLLFNNFELNYQSYVRLVAIHTSHNIVCIRTRSIKSNLFDLYVAIAIARKGALANDDGFIRLFNSEEGIGAEFLYCSRVSVVGFIGRN